jgi:hypothetical protein
MRSSLGCIRFTPGPIFSPWGPARGVAMSSQIHNTSGGALTFGVAGAATVRLAEGESVEVRAIHNHGSNRNVTTGLNLTYFYGFRVEA